MSYRRVKIGPVEVSEDKKTVEVKGQNFAKLTKLKPWSTYEITTTAYNLLENRKLESKPSQAYHSSTSADSKFMYKIFHIVLFHRKTLPAVQWGLNKIMYVPVFWGFFTVHFP